MKIQSACMRLAREANLEDLDRALSAEWAAEARDRLAAYHSGELAAVEIEDVIGSSRRS